MNTTEATRLCRAIASMTPAQRFDDETPALWGYALGDTRYADARDAVVAILRRQPYVAVADIVTEVQRIRLARLESADAIEPNVHPDNVVAWMAERRAITAALADGTLDVERYAAGGWTLTGSPPKAIEGPERERPPVDYGKTFKSPPLPRGIDYVTTNKPPTTVGHRDAEAMEAERRRQLAALEPLTQDGAA